MTPDRSPHAGPREPGRDDPAGRHPQPAAAAAASAERRAAAPGGRGGRRATTSSSPSPTTSAPTGGLAPWVVVAAGVAGVPHRAAAAVRRRRRRLEGRCGDTAGARGASTTGRIAGAWAEAIDRCTEAGAPRLTDVTPQERVAVYVDDAATSTSRTRPAPPGRPGRPGGVRGRRHRATSTPPTRGAAATRWPPSCAGSAAPRRRLRMQLDPRPLRATTTPTSGRPRRRTASR